MPKILYKSDYIKLGKLKGLLHTDPLTPKNMRTITNWQCEDCGTTYRKTLRAVMNAAYGCYCQSPQTLSDIDYFNLAFQLNIRWIAKVGNLPKNNKSITEWVGPKGEVVKASYHQLSRPDKITKKLREALGI